MGAAKKGAPLPQAASSSNQLNKNVRKMNRDLTQQFENARQLRLQRWQDGSKCSGLGFH